LFFFFWRGWGEDHPEFEGSKSRGMYYVAGEE